MLRALVAIVVSGALVGCSFLGLANDRPHAPVAEIESCKSNAKLLAILDATGAIVGLAGGGSILFGSSGDDEPPIDLALGLAAAGSVLLVSAIYGALDAKTCGEVTLAQRDRDVDFERRKRIDRLARAWAATKTAQEAARNGDCAKATAIATEVEEIDAEFYVTVFARDVAIARCLGAERGGSASGGSGASR